MCPSCGFRAKQPASRLSMVSCLPQTPHPGCRGSAGPGNRPGLLWGVHLAWVSPNLGHADPPPDSSSWTSAPVCPNKRVFSYPSWCLCSVHSGRDARGRSPEKQPSSLLHPWTGRRTPKLPSVWGRGTRTLIQHSWGWREAHQQLPWGVTAEEEARLGCSHFPLHPPGWAQPAFRPHLCALHRLFPKCPIRTILRARLESL